jgi:hypothetical protein
MMLFILPIFKGKLPEYHGTAESLQTIISNISILQYGTFPQCNPWDHNCQKWLLGGIYESWFYWYRTDGRAHGDAAYRCGA